MIIWALTVTLTLKITNQSSCATLWPKMHHHTKFGYKRFSSWGGIVQINIHWNFECFLWPWPWSQQRNPIFLEANPAYNGMPQKSSLVLFNHRELHQGCFLKHNLAHDDISPYQVIAVKGSAVQKTSSGQTFIDILKFCRDFDLEPCKPIFS